MITVSTGKRLLAAAAFAVVPALAAAQQPFKMEKANIGGDGGTDYVTADPATGNVDTSQSVGKTSYLKVPLGNRTAVQATTSAVWAGNFDSRAFTTAGTASTSSALRVFDSLGAPHDLTLTVTESSTPNSWNYAVTGAGGETMTNATGTLAFDPKTGALLSGSPGSVTIQPVAATGTPAFTVAMDFSKFSQVATDLSIQASSQNGYGPGSLTNYSISPDGTIVGLYTNGLTRSLGQIGSVLFPNAAGLERQGNNLWRGTDNSGVPVVGAAGSGGRGVISSGFLEQSNVDISNEFTDLIVTQRGFQANTKVVTVVDELLQEVINMKR